MNTVIAFVVGLFIGGIVCFFVTSCLFIEHRWDRQNVWNDGYNAGWKDGLKGVDTRCVK